MIVIIYSKLKVNGLALWPFIIVRNIESLMDKSLINHERIHLRQELELLIIPFYVIYGINWLVNLFKYKSRYEAYRNIAFEREAYQNETDMNYLKNRKAFSFLKYLKKK